MDSRELIAGMKCAVFEQADARAIPVRNSQGARLGKLVPVGPWILAKTGLIEQISAWRQTAMRMFLTQFESTPARTEGYLRNIAIRLEDRLFFMLYDEADRPIGHMGVMGMDGKRGELDNLMRGVDGGDPRLVYFAELALLDWCFSALGLSTSEVRVISYNWLVVDLHAEVGYVFAENVPLRKYEEDGMTCHDELSDAAQANVKYSSTRMLLDRADFYTRAPWLRVPPQA